MDSLTDIGTKYGTLKVQHGYMPIYERMINRDDIGVVLEIGVHQGASLRTWRDWFPYAKIVGVDKVLLIEPEERIFVMQCDAQEVRITGFINLIIDDGSHIASEQLATFKNLWPNVAAGGWYVIEDLFALYDPVWNPSGDNILDLIQSRMKNILVGGDEIQEVHYFGRNDINGILFLRKRYEPFRIQPLSEFQ